MSPDSSEDAAKSKELKVKREKIMFTSPYKLKKSKDVPDCARFINETTATESIFGGQVESRLDRTSSDKYDAIAENFNLYDTPDDSLCDNNVTSSNYVTESSEEAGGLSKNKSEAERTNASNVPRTVKTSSRKKQVTVAEEVTTSNESKPHSPVSLPNGKRKGILKVRELSIEVENYSRKMIDEVLKMNEVSAKITAQMSIKKSFPEFIVKKVDYGAEKEKTCFGKNNNVSSNYVYFNNRREPNPVNDHREEGKLRK